MNFVNDNICSFHPHNQKKKKNTKNTKQTNKQQKTTLLIANILGSNDSENPKAIFVASIFTYSICDINTSLISYHEVEMLSVRTSCI